MKFIKKNKYTVIAIVIFLALVLIAATAKNILVPDEGKAVYGDRLDGIENYPLSDDTLNGIDTKLKENEKVTNSSTKLHGKIINIIITVSDDVSLDDAKKIASDTTSLFTKSELSYYSLQVFVKKDNSSLNNFPIIGYKDPNGEMKFTKDRDITEGETDEE